MKRSSGVRTKFNVLSSGLLFGLAGLGMLSCAAKAQSGSQPYCGGIDLNFGTTVAIVNRQPRSIEAVGALTRANGTRPLGWIVWDERAMPWLAIARISPTAVQKLVTFSKASLNFSLHPELKFRFAPLRGKLPKAYRVTSCDAVRT